MKQRLLSFIHLLCFMQNRPAHIIASLLMGLSLFFGCHPRTEVIDMPQISERGELVAITGYSPFSYFVYRGEVMGYDYELLGLLEDYLDISVRIVLAHDFDEMIRMLEHGKGDLIAYGLTVTAERRERLAFTDPMNMTRQVLVQRRPDNWRQMMLHQIENELIRNPLALSGKTIHVRRGSAYTERLRNLSREIGAEIHISEAEKGVTTEQLIRKVAEKEIDYTVADENIATMQSAYYQNLDVSTAISLPQYTAWAVRPSSVLLLDTLNTWLQDARKHVDYYVIYNKYYENRRTFRLRYGSEYFPITGGTISPYDSLLKEQSARINWDWRLLAALVFRESRFDPYARSWAGAEGLMQLMPQTAKAFGAENPYDPIQNIIAGVRFLEWLDNYWSQEIADENQRLHFIIASYNAGQGHVQDARRLARADGADPDIWFGNVEKYMLKKSNPDYYLREEVVYGYAAGEEPVTYVQNILNLHNHYKQFFD